MSFEKAAQVLRDPLQVLIQDRIEHGEERWQTFGIVHGVLLVMVAHTVHEEDQAETVVRIISARRADRKERRFYEDENGCHTLDTLPPLTEAQKAHLKALAARPESEIDYSDIPALTEEQYKHGRRGVFYRPVKRQITARVDADVLDWLKAQGKGYQSRITPSSAGKCSPPPSRNRRQHERQSIRPDHARLEDAKAYTEGEREGYRVTVPSPAQRKSWAELRAAMPQESRECMDQRLQATLAPWIRQR